MKKSIFLLSSSNVHGHGYLEYNKGAILSFLEGITTPILFVPFAAGKSEWDSYTAKIATFFAPAGIAVEGIHTVAADRIFSDFEVIFIAGRQYLPPTASTAAKQSARRYPRGCPRRPHVLYRIECGN